MIIHRPHRGGLEKSMAEAREFNSLGECINTLISEFNSNYGDCFEVTPEDICICPYGEGDNRIGWKDLFMICCVPYNIVNDKEGYERYFGGRSNCPQQFFGFISTDYK